MHKYGRRAHFCFIFRLLVNNLAPTEKAFRRCFSVIPRTTILEQLTVSDSIPVSIIEKYSHWLLFYFIVNLMQTYCAGYLKKSLEFLSS